MIKTDKRTELKALLKGKEIYSKRTKERAIDSVLANLVASSSLAQGRRGIPGEAIKAMPKAIRDILEECTAEDWNHRLENTNWIKR